MIKTLLCVICFIIWTIREFVLIFLLNQYLILFTGNTSWMFHELLIKHCVWYPIMWHITMKMDFYRHFLRQNMISLYHMVISIYLFVDLILISSLSLYVPGHTHFSKNLHIYMLIWLCVYDFCYRVLILMLFCIIFDLLGYMYLDW